MKTLLLVCVLAVPAFARIHDNCQVPASNPQAPERAFGTGYVGGILDTVRDKTINGLRVYTIPDGLTYETGFAAVCAEIAKHPEMWDEPSKEAVDSAIDTLWKRTH